MVIENVACGEIEKKNIRFTSKPFVWWSSCSIYFLFLSNSVYLGFTSAIYHHIEPMRKLLIESMLHTWIWFGFHSIHAIEPRAFYGRSIATILRLQNVDGLSNFRCMVIAHTAHCWWYGNQLLELCGYKSVWNEFLLCFLHLKKKKTRLIFPKRKRTTSVIILLIHFNMLNVYNIEWSG